MQGSVIELGSDGATERRSDEGEEAGAPFFGYSRRVGDDDDVRGIVWVFSAELSPTLASQEWGTRAPWTHRRQPGRRSIH